MREILFRGKDQRTGKWHIGYYAVRIDRFCNMQTEIMQTDGSRVAVDWESVGQFSGLFDKNGVKIFEGEIVTGIAYSQEWVGNIIWIKEIASFGLNHGHDIAWENSSILKRAAKGINDEFSAEIIGNIYDNPELLKRSVGNA